MVNHTGGAGSFSACRPIKSEMQTMQKMDGAHPFFFGFSSGHGGSGKVVAPGAYMRLGKILP